MFEGVSKHVAIGVPRHGGQRTVLDAVNFVAVAPHASHVTGGAVAHPDFQLTAFVPGPSVPVAVRVHRQRSKINIGPDGQVQHPGVLACFSPILPRRQGREDVIGTCRVHVVAARLFEQQGKVHSRRILKAFFEVARHPNHVQGVGDYGLTEHIGDVFPDPVAHPPRFFTGRSMGMDYVPGASGIPNVQGRFRGPRLSDVAVQARCEPLGKGDAGGGGAQCFLPVAAVQNLVEEQAREVPLDVFFGVFPNAVRVDKQLRPHQGGGAADVLGIELATSNVGLTEFGLLVVNQHLNGAFNVAVIQAFNFLDPLLDF